MTEAKCGPRRPEIIGREEAHRRRVAFHADIARRAAALLRPSSQAIASAPAAPCSIEAPAPPCSIEPPVPVKAPVSVSYETKLRLTEILAFEVTRYFDDSQVTVSAIINAVCEQFSVSRSALLSNRRTADVVDLRQCAMWLCREFTRQSLPAIGRKFGGRDHTTVLHGIRVAPVKLAADNDLRVGIMKVYTRLATLSAEAEEAVKLLQEIASFPEHRTEQ
jgi:hypothetical protein